jgi:hypothetical protein
MGKWLQDKVNAPGLTLRLVVVEPQDDDDFPFNIYRRLPTQSEGRLVTASYLRLACPLTLLVDKGLARFYAKLIFSEFWTKEFRERPAIYRSSWAERRARETKRHIERFVTGSRYESMYANDRVEPARSHWEHWYQPI